MLQMLLTKVNNRRHLIDSSAAARRILQLVSLRTGPRFMPPLTLCRWLPYTCARSRGLSTDLNAVNYMKADRREELKHNELADWFGERLEAVQPHFGPILLAGALIVCGVLGGFWYLGGTER